MKTITMMLIAAALLAAGCKGANKKQPAPPPPAAAPKEAAKGEQSGMPGMKHEKVDEKAAGDAKLAFDAKPAAGTKARCPVTGQAFTVAANTVGSVHEGKHYVYCCAGCKPKFDADPKKYLKK